MRQENAGITMPDCWHDSIKPDCTYFLGLQKANKGFLFAKGNGS